MSAFPIKGEVGPRFEAVRRAFEDNFARGDELGAAFAVWRDGETVVDLRGGFSDRARESPWAENTLAGVYSSGKAVITALVARAVGDGRLDYERAIAADWPDFAAVGKGAVTLAEALSHQAGLCGFPEEFPPEQWLDHETMAARLAALAPLWPPGSANGYHPQTVGIIVAELFRRVGLDSVGAQIRRAISPLGLDLHCGCGADEIARAAYMQKPSRPGELGPLTPLKEYAFLKPWSSAGRVTREAWMAAEIPASNMHATAKGLAGAAYPLAHQGRAVDGSLFADPSAVAAALKVRRQGDDLVLPFHLAWSAGLMKNVNGHFGPSSSAYGHAGHGGSAIMIDPEKRVAAAYVMNKMSSHLAGDPRAVRLFEALDACL